jgi:uncharacterized protein (TIGR00369 family)
MSDLQEGLDPDTLTFDRHYGLELVSASAERVEARIAVDDRHRQPFGIVHGGVYCSIAESVASIGTYLGVRDDGNIALGVSNQTSFLRPVREGSVHATAVPCHQGRTMWIWDVEMTNDDGKLVAVSRMTIAVRPLQRD